MGLMWTKPVVSTRTVAIPTQNPTGVRIIFLSNLVKKCCTRKSFTILRTMLGRNDARDVIDGQKVKVTLSATLTFATVNGKHSLLQSLMAGFSVLQNPIRIHFSPFFVSLALARIFLLRGEAG